jgi:PAS domain-containing protein
MEGSAPARRIGLQLEKIVGNLEQLQKQIAKRESGMQTIFSAMQDALLVVDSNRQVILTNQTFRKLFDAPEISVATPLLEIVRDPTLDRLLTDAFRGDGPIRRSSCMPSRRRTTPARSPAHSFCFMTSRS